MSDVDSAIGFYSEDNDSTTSLSDSIQERYWENGRPYQNDTDLFVLLLPTTSLLTSGCRLPNDEKEQGRRDLREGL
jgi:hypothetical protein